MDHSTLFATGRRIGHGSGEEAIPIHSSVGTSKVVIPVAGVNHEPWNDCVRLLVREATLTLTISTPAHAPHGSSAGLALLHIIVTVDKFTALTAVFQGLHLQQTQTGIKTNQS